MTSTATRPLALARLKAHPFIAQFAHLVVDRPDVWKEWVTLTPELADYLLETCNNGNRRCRRTRVNRYKNDNQSPGQWVETGETLIITKSRLGASLQHRCRMVQETRVPIVVLMVIGVDDRTMDVCDGGLAKTYCDRPAPQGALGTMMEGSAASFKSAYDAGVMDDAARRSALSDAQKRLVVLENPGLTAALIELPAVPALWGGRGLWAFLMSEFSARDRALATEFMSRVLMGLQVPPGSQEQVLRIWLDRNAKKAGLRGERGRSAVYIGALVVKSWNVLRTGGPVKKSLKWTDDEPFPKIV